MPATIDGAYSLFSSTTLNQELYFLPNTTDSFSQKAWKFSVGTALTSSSFCLAIAETALLAILAAASYPVFFISPLRYSKITSILAHSAQNISLAARRTFGAEIEQAIQPKNYSFSVEKADQHKASRFKLVCKKHQTSLIAIAIAITALGAYYFAPTSLPTQPEPIVLIPPKPPIPFAPPTAFLPSPSKLTERNVADQTNKDTIIGTIITTIAVPFFAAWPIAFLLV